jgi:hypothetical protein
MIDLAVASGAAAVAGGIVAATVRNRRGVALGLAVALAAAPFAASPLPGTLGLAARVAGALLAAEVLLVACRVRRVRSEGSAIGVVAETAIAAAAFVVGLWIAPVKPLAGPATEQAAGLALVVLALIPMTGRDVLRIGVGTILLALGLSLLREAWLGPAQPFENLTLAALFVALAGATGLLISRSRRQAEYVEDATDAETVAAEDGTGAAATEEDDSTTEVLPPLKSPRPGSTLRRTRNPRGSEPLR